MNRLSRLATTVAVSGGVALANVVLGAAPRMPTRAAVAAA
jgi:hypothetical protein